MGHEGRLIYRCVLPRGTEHGTYSRRKPSRLTARRGSQGRSSARSSMSCVGVQPFGGEALSGTGPKAGGPRYLYRFATERTVSTDTTAAGGNATLLSLGEEAEP
jgi:hypothetical protein